MLCVFIIFLSQWLIISCNEMSPVLRPNESKIGGKETRNLPLKLSADMNRNDHTTVDAGDVNHVPQASRPTPAPMKGLEAILLNFLYGHKTDGEEESDDYPITESDESIATNYSHFPTGRLLHSELFLNKSGVHLPPPDLLHPGHCRLRITADYMQTAVDAFAIIHEGNLADVRALPAEYVLRSVRLFHTYDVSYSSVLFLNKSGVHLPQTDLLHPGHCRLRITADYMQTAVDAFAIIHEGNLADVRALPAEYVLRSVRLFHTYDVTYSSVLFLNKSGVHLPPPDLLHPGHCRLRITADYMQTAVDAFAIIHEGNLADVRALPAEYVLRSARTIAIMRLPQEKLSAMWDVVLNGRKPNTITYETLEFYRPLFKYLSGKQMARLNLTDKRIVNYIGTHPDLSRHQVGVVASKYIKENPHWNSITSLNNMNNLLCGVPMTFMRKLDGAEYLRLEHQVFYHIRACDPLQKRFYLNMMTRTQALGKSFSWSARDVSRLGLLLAEVEGPALAAISPEAMVGVSSHVMFEMKPENLKYLTDLQVKYIKRKARNIMSRKLKEYDALMADAACRVATNILLTLLFAFTIVIKMSSTNKEL